MVLRGTSFNAWCNARGYKYQNVRMACLGIWIGPRATQLCGEVANWVNTADFQGDLPKSGTSQ